MTIPTELIAEAISWRHEFHANPELAYEEYRTSARIAELLKSFGLEVKVGIGGTGVVGTLRHGQGPSVGLRADIDALPLDELGSISYRSLTPGCMHACGHDGHTAILLATAKLLSETLDFHGTLYFIFQPAEEGLAGAKAMIDDGLFTDFPMDSIYSLHNWPGLDVGYAGINEGAMMASLDTFDITITGKGCHAAMPECGTDSILVAAELVQRLNTIVSRQLSPLSNAVLSITQIHAGDAYNILPEKVVLRGTVRCLQPETREVIENLISKAVASVEKQGEVSTHFCFTRGYPVTLNHSKEADNVRKAVIMARGESRVRWNIHPSMASEDFSYMLESCKGAYFWLGARGEDVSTHYPLHSPYYDFNDNIIEDGIAIWQALVSNLLSKV
ncbi:amidohydrolase [Tatumella sp. JGM118]|uniref:amidohydrolase n=1 Tax=Tatumella sp. JGM118 TaxID=2799796 RepID=UPI001BAE838F|nr:amidohydrolase [Tatumella sp. JGM118]MBS0909534.1 amidohydrolase [Tatumella sp. JGM118]